MGIDISKHNGNIDWNAVKNSGVQYVILRCGYRGSASGVLVEDQKFKRNIQGATAAGLKVGIYFFSQAVNEVEAVEEASMTLSLIKNYRITYPVYIDVESANGRADGISKAARTSVINAFCQTIRNSGYTPGLYANKNWLTEKDQYRRPWRLQDLAGAVCCCTDLWRTLRDVAVFVERVDCRNQRKC